MGKDVKRVRGECVQWDEERAFGFIQMDGKVKGEDLFVHCKDVQGADSLRVGGRVECEVGVNPENGKKIAVRVTVIKDAPSANRIRGSQTRSYKRTPNRKRRLKRGAKTPAKRRKMRF